MKWCALLLLLLSISFVQAQESDALYRLRQPTATEYVSAIQAIAEAAPFDSDTTESPSGLIGDAIDAVLFRRYPDLDNVDWLTLSKVYNQLLINLPLFSIRRDQQAWNQAIIRSYLHAHPMELARIRHFQFAEYDIFVTPRDFNSDGVDEYLLDVRTYSSNFDRATCEGLVNYVDYLIVQPEADRYRFIDTPSLWHAPNAGRMYTGTGSIDQLDFRDINDDGLPEWILVEGAITFGGPGMGYEDGGRLYVLGWRDNAIVDLTPLRLSGWDIAENTDYLGQETIGCVPYPPDVRWQFENIDVDPALEILQQQSYTDNWFCELIETKIFDWSPDEDTYIFLRS